MSAPTSSEVPVLVCRARSLLCALSLQHVAETTRPLPIEPVIGMPSFVYGLSVIRGKPVPVLDLGSLVGSREKAHPSRFVVLRTGDRQVAAAVEQVVGIRTLSSGSLDALPPLLSKASAASVSTIGTLDTALILVLNTAKLAPELASKVMEVGK